MTWRHAVEDKYKTETAQTEVDTTIAQQTSTSSLIRAAPCLGLAAFSATLLAGAIGCHPRIPHPASTANDSYCVKCHVGRAGAPASDHNQRTGCTSCHTATARGSFPALIPHRGGEESRCALCHKEGTHGAPRASHLNEARCYSCHQSSDYGPWPPSVPHAIESAADPQNCMNCHTGADHGDSSTSCLVCHKG